MGGSKRQRPAPSYEEGRLRDRSIERMQDPGFQPEHLGRLVKKALRQKGDKAPEGGRP